MFRKITKPLSIVLFSLAASQTVTAAQDIFAENFQNAINGDNRTASYVERDKFRNPEATLRFFEVRPDSVVVEIWPGGGWYTEILAPLLKSNGKLYAAHFPDMEKPPFFKMARNRFLEKMSSSDIYSNVEITGLFPPAHNDMAPANSADIVLTFRSVHNWIKPGISDNIMNSAYKALKPGGILGVVEHRAKPGTSLEDMISSGYVTEDYVKEIAAKAGFTYVGSSEVNANAEDTKDHPEGVWTLPPSLRLKDQDKDKYLAIGETDRMTLKFVKK